MTYLAEQKKNIIFFQKQGSLPDLRQSVSSVKIHFQILRPIMFIELYHFLKYREFRKQKDKRTLLQQFFLVKDQNIFSPQNKFSWVGIYQYSHVFSSNNNTVIIFLLIIFVISSTEYITSVSTEKNSDFIQCKYSSITVHNLGRYSKFTFLSPLGVLKH